MPFGDDTSEFNVRLLCYGKAGTKKTWFAMNAALAGFNVILFDGDQGGAIARQVDPTIKRRIRIIRCHDRVDRPVFADFILRFLKNETIQWDDKDNKIIFPGQKWKPDHAHWVLDMSRLTMNDVVVMDSWDAFMLSCMHTKFTEDKQDYFASKISDLRGTFGYQSRIGTTALQKVCALPCHVIVVAHEQVNEITEPQYDSEKDVVNRIPTGEVYSQPQSSSRNHGLTLAAKFTDVLYHYVRGERVKITTKPNEARDGKTRLVFKDDDWEKIQFKDFSDAIGAKGDPSIECEACKYYPIGETRTATAATQKPAVSLPTTATVPSSTDNPVIGAQAAAAKTTLFSLTKKQES